MSSLVVLADGERVGAVELERGLWKLSYAAGWNAFALSPNFPLATREFADSPAKRSVEWFFDNLVPEGRLRELIALQERIDPRDTWALLARHGQDTAGALSVLPEGVEWVAEERLVPLSPAQLNEKIKESRHRNLPLMASWDEVRMSLAGAQEKLALRIDASGALFLPEGSSPSTHIVKPENVSVDFPFCTANEFFCMRLASELRLPVPTAGLLHLPEPLYVIERFDREHIVDEARGGGQTVRRIHQIDLCQVIGVAASKKYEGEGGLGLHDLFEVTRGAFIERPIVAANAVIQWVIFNYLVGNLDAHAKNIAFLMRGSTAAVAPFYDILCVEAYLPREPMSMAIAGENKPGWVEGPHWDAFAYEAGVAPRAVRDVLGRMSAALPAAVSAVINDDRLRSAERDFLGDKVLPVIEERRQFVADALRSAALPKKDLLEHKGLEPAVLERLARR